MQWAEVIVSSKTRACPCSLLDFLLVLIVMATATASTPAEEIRASAYVGFDSITAQIEHKLLKRGFQFNVICVGMLPHLDQPPCDSAHR